MWFAQRGLAFALFVAMQLVRWLMVQLVAAVELHLEGTAFHLLDRAEGSGPHRHGDSGLAFHGQLVGIDAAAGAVGGAAGLVDSGLCAGPDRAPTRSGAPIE